MRLSVLALITRVVAAHAIAAPTIMRSPIAWRGSTAGVGKPKATAMPANDSASPIHWGRWKRSAGRKIRAPSTTKNGAR